MTFAILGAFCTHNVRIFREADFNAEARRRRGTKLRSAPRYLGGYFAGLYKGPWHFRSVTFSFVQFWKGNTPLLLYWFCSSRVGLSRHVGRSPRYGPTGRDATLGDGQGQCIEPSRAAPCSITAGLTTARPYRNNPTGRLRRTHAICPHT